MSKLELDQSDLELIIKLIEEALLSCANWNIAKNVSYPATQRLTALKETIEKQLADKGV